MTEDEIIGCYHLLNGHGFGWTPGVGDGQGGLVCDSWGCKESDMTERLNWTELGMQKEDLPQNLWILKTGHFLENRPSLFVYIVLAHFLRLWKSLLAWLSNKHSTLDHVLKFKDIDFILRKQEVLCYKVIFNLGFEGWMWARWHNHFQ